MDICGIFVICLVAIGAIFLILLSLLLFPFFWLFGAKRAHYVLINYLADYYWVFMMWMVEIGMCVLLFQCCYQLLLQLAEQGLYSTEIKFL